MARNLTQAQIAMLQSPSLDARTLVTFYLDAGTYYFCDDIQDVQDGNGINYVGAAALGASVDIVSSKPFAAESVTLICDGARMAEAGIKDPAALFATILTMPLSQRRVNIAIGFKYLESTVFGLVVPMYGGKINNAKVVDAQIDPTKLADGSVQNASTLQIQLDSLASRYQNIVGRTRSHSDQQEIDSTDLFFQYVGDTLDNERNLFWGMNAPAGIQSLPAVGNVSVGGGGAIGGGGSGRMNSFRQIAS